MKKMISLILILLFCLMAATACSSGGSNAPTAPAEASAVAPATTTLSETAAAEPHKQYTIAVSMYSSDEFRTQTTNSLKTVAEARGYKFISASADADPSKQISDIEAMIQQKPDLIAIYAVDAEAAVAAVEAVKAAGIKCVAVDYAINTKSYDAYIADDQQLHGQIQGQYVLDWLNKDTSRVANVGYIIGSYAETAMDRHDGFVETCNHDVNNRVNLLSEQCGNWNADDAMAITEDWMQKYPEMNVFVCMNDDMAIGCIQALKAAGRNMEDVLVLGIDGTEVGLKAVRAGELDATTLVDNDEFAVAVMDVCDRVLAGETFTKTVKPGIIRAVTIDNVDD